MIDGNSLANYAISRIWRLMLACLVAGAAIGALVLILVARACSSEVTP